MKNKIKNILLPLTAITMIAGTATAVIGCGNNSKESVSQQEIKLPKWPSAYEKMFRDYFVKLDDFSKFLFIESANLKNMTLLEYFIYLNDRGLT